MVIKILDIKCEIDVAMYYMNHIKLQNFDIYYIFFDNTNIEIINNNKMKKATSKKKKKRREFDGSSYLQGTDDRRRRKE